MSTELAKGHSLTVGRVSLADGGISLSRLVSGCWRLIHQSKGDLTTVRKFIDTALGLGVTSFDHADIYGGYQVEALFGRALAARPGLRASVELITKCGIAPISPCRPGHRVLHINTSADHIVASAENSLRAFKTDWLDLLLLHRPDPLMEADELAGALVALREAGKVRAFGVSNFSVGQFDLLQSRLPFRLVTNQIEISLLQTKSLLDGTLDHLQQHRLPAMAWSPLAGGRLLAGDDQRTVAVRSILMRLAAQQCVDPAAVAIAWVLRLPGVAIPVLGSSEPTKLERAVKAAHFLLDRQDWFELLASTGFVVA